MSGETADAADRPYDRRRRPIRCSSDYEQRGFYLHTRTHARTRKVNLEAGNLISAVTGHTRTRTRAHTLTNDSSSLQGHGADIMENGSLFFTIITGIGRVSC